MHSDIRHWLEVVARSERATLREQVRNSNWVCFKDRKIVRRPGKHVFDEPPICPACREPMVNGGDQLAVPRATDERGWRAFEAEVKRRA